MEYREYKRGKGSMKPSSPQPEKLAKELRWKIIDEALNSRVILIAKKDWEGRKIDFGDPIPDKLSTPFKY